MRFKPYLLVLLLLLAVSLVSAVKPEPQLNSAGLEVIYPKAQAYEYGQDFNIYIMVVNISNGLALDNTAVTLCSLYVSNHSNNDIIVARNFSYYGSKIFNVSVSNSSFEVVGFYPYAIYCYAGTTSGGIVSDEITISVDGAGELTEGNSFIVAIIILIPLLFSFLILKWVDILGETHNALRLGMSLLSVILVMMSLWFSGLSVVKFLYWNAMSEALSTSTLLFGGLFFVIVSYFCIVIIYNVFMGIKKKKEERLEI